MLTLGGFVALGVALLVLSLVLAPDTPLWQLVVVFSLMGLGSSFLWGPLATTANRNLAPQRAGAGSGVYNATRQVGAVLGSAAIAVLIDARLVANGLTFSPSEGSAGGGALPGAGGRALHRRDGAVAAPAAGRAAPRPRRGAVLRAAAPLRRPPGRARGGTGRRGRTRRLSGSSYALLAPYTQTSGA